MNKARRHHNSWTQPLRLTREQQVRGLDLLDQIQEEREASQDIWEKDADHITGAEVIDLSVTIWAMNELNDELDEVLGITGTAREHRDYILGQLQDGNRRARRGSL